MRTRVLEPELLDSLPANDPAAQANRRDLRRIHGLAGTVPWMAGRIRSAALADKARSPEPPEVVEWGAGDGLLVQRVRRKEGIGPGCGIIQSWTAIDTAPQAADWPEGAGLAWWRQDLTEAPLPAGTTILAGRLILHQFEAPTLRELGTRILLHARLGRLLFAEPWRARSPLLLLALGRFIGFHDLTLHDGAISIRAGFRRGELGPMLGLEPDKWRVRESIHPAGLLRFEAVRRNTHPLPRPQP